MRDSLTEEPKRLLGWLSGHIRSFPGVQKTGHSKNSPKRMPAAQIATDYVSPPPSARYPISVFMPTLSKPSPPIFHKFALLPSELRLQIWELALFTTPRVVKFNEIINFQSGDLLVSTPVPSSLQICSETRELALKHYIFSEGNIKLYLDPEIDSLYFSNHCEQSTLQMLAGCAKMEDLRSLRKLVVDESFLYVLGRSVWNASGSEAWEGPPFKLLSGLEELIVVQKPVKGKSRGESMLGPLSYERHCTTCQKMDWWVGLDGWVFPTYQQFVSMERWGVENKMSENSYKAVLKMPHRARSAWLWGFVDRRMQNICRVDYDRRQGPGQGKIRACSVAGLHRFVDLLNE